MFWVYAAGKGRNRKRVISRKQFAVGNVINRRKYRNMKQAERKYFTLQWIEKGNEIVAATHQVKRWVLSMLSLRSL